MTLGRRSRPRRRAHPLRVGGGFVVVDNETRSVSPLDPAEPQAADDMWRMLVENRALGRCQARLHPDCPGWGAQAHHRLRRQHPGANRVENGRWVCHLCHGWLHFRLVDWARRHLWLISPGHPLDPPVSCPLTCALDHRRGLQEVHAS